jgi:hypothetical protein
MSTCQLLDPFQHYLEMSVVFCLSIHTATTKTSTGGNENFLLGIIFLGGSGNANKNVGLRVIA